MITVFFKTKLFLTETRDSFVREDIGYVKTVKELMLMLRKNEESDIAIVVDGENFQKSIRSQKQLLESPRIFFLLLVSSEKECSVFDGVAVPYRLDFLKKPYSFNDLRNKLYKLQHIATLDNYVSVLNKELQTKEAQLEERFFVDYLTGSYNYHYLVSKLSFCMQKLREQMLPLVFIMIDIDSFQKIVDTHSFAYGEEVIKQLSAYIRGQIRTSDILIRSGGEEFILLLPHTSKKQGIFVSRRLKVRIEQQRYGTDKKKIAIGISMGLSFSSKERPHSVKSLLKEAQKALKFSKRKGGSAVSVYQERLDVSEKETPDEAIKKLRGKVYLMRERAQQDLIEMVYGFARLIEAKDDYTGKHVEDTSVIAEKLATELKVGLSKKENIKHAAILHDLGKIGVGQEILQKPGKLTAQEMKIMQRHPIIAAEILKYIKALRGALPAIKYHHEWYNGKGYPCGLKGEEIPIEARIVAIADVYQALTSDRPYRKAFPKEQALGIIKKEAGTHFDPKVVEAFLRIV